MASSAAFTFPILRSEEIVKCLHEAGVRCTEDDFLREITPERASHLYHDLLKVAHRMRSVKDAISRSPGGWNIFADDDKDMNLIPEAPFNVLSKLEDYHEEAYYENRSLKKLFNLFHLVGASDFTLVDLIRPDLKKLRRHVSAICNFLKFKEEHVEKYRSLARAADAHVAHVQEAQQTTLEMRQELVRLQARQREAEKRMQFLVPAISELEATVYNLNVEQSNLNNAIVADKKRFQDLQDRITSERLTAANLAAEVKSLSGQVVQSPIKMKKRLEEMRSQLEAEKMATADAERMKASLEAKIAALIKLEKDIGKCTRVLEECGQQVGRKKELSHALKDSQSRIQESSKRGSEMSGNVQRLATRILETQDKLSACKHEQRQKQAAAQQQLEEARYAVRKAEIDAAAAKKKTDYNRADAADIEEETERLIQEHNTQVRTVHDEVERMQSQVREYHVALHKAMEHSSHSASIQAY